MRQISGALSTQQNRLLANLVARVRQSKKSVQIDEGLSQVEVARAVFARSVILRKRVVIVVKAFAVRAYAHQYVFDRVYGLVVGFHAPHVS